MSNTEYVMSLLVAVVIVGSLGSLIGVLRRILKERRHVLLLLPSPVASPRTTALYVRLAGGSTYPFVQVETRAKEAAAAASLEMELVVPVLNPAANLSNAYRVPRSLWTTHTPRSGVAAVSIESVAGSSMALTHAVTHRGGLVVRGDRTETQMWVLFPSMSEAGQAT